MIQGVFIGRKKSAAANVLKSHLAASIALIHPTTNFVVLIPVVI